MKNYKIQNIRKLMKVVTANEESNSLTGSVTYIMFITKEEKLHFSSKTCGNMKN